MQKFSLSLILFLSLFNSVSLFASEDYEKIIVKEVNGTVRTRGIVVLPEVWFDDESNLLSIMFDRGTLDVFTVTVYDEYNTPVYRGSIVSDGSNYDFILPELSYGSYTFIIENSNASYEGYLHL